MTMLALKSLRATALQVPGADPWYANPHDPALTVMTDFRERPSVTVSEMAPIDSALEHMKHAGVRSAFATDGAGRAVVGLITAYDIMSEKPMRFVQAIGSTRSDVLVRDIMQPVSEWQVLDIADIERATVAAVARLLTDTQLSHVPVMESGANGERRLRGLLSSARVKRLLSR
jgi:CBS domain-containing protein